MLYKHNMLFDRDKVAVQKTYRIPRQLEGYIAQFAKAHRCTNTDVVVDALLHYFSDQIVVDLTNQLRDLNEGMEREGGHSFVGKSLLKKYRRFDLLLLEFYEYFIDSITQKLGVLKDSQVNAGCMNLSKPGASKR